MSDWAAASSATVVRFLPVAVPRPIPAIGLPLALLLLAATAPAQASQMYVYSGGYYPQVGDYGVAGYDEVAIGNTTPGNTVVGGSTPVASEVGAGADELTPAFGPGSALQTYCVDVAHYLIGSGGTATYNVLSDSDPATISYFSNVYTGASGAAIVGSLEHLASNWLGSVNSTDASAAFQIAVWDLTFGSGFTANANGADGTIVNSLVAEYLGNLSGAITEQLTFLQDPSWTSGMQVSQHLITFTPVPLPAAAWLLLSGVAGLGGLTRLRRSTAP
jgi:hypothetical protein